MKKIILSFFTMISSLSLFAQIPNPGFENWTSTSYVNILGWNTYGKITRVQPATNGVYALRMERDPQNPNPPGAIVYGNPSGNNYYGGIPFADRPDSLVADFKYDVMPGDSAWVLCIFKKNGVPIAQDQYFITGSNTASFVRKAFKVNFQNLQVPDTLFIGFTSTSPNNTILGGYVVIDNVHFIGTLLTVPNGSFESWNTYVDEEPNGWYTPNMSLLMNPTLPVTKTTDRYSGTYAIRMENVITQNGLGMGYALAGPQGQNGPLPGFPVQFKDTSLNGYYKFYPLNGDTMTLGVEMYELGVMVGAGFMQSTATVSSYSPFTIPINYVQNYTGTPDSATVLLLAFSGGSLPRGNSVLFVDNLSFDQLLTGENSMSKDPFSISNYPNPFSNSTLIEYSLPANEKVAVKIMDVTGREVAVLFSGEQAEGYHSVSFDGSALAGGIYHLIIETNGARSDRKIVVQK